MGDKEHNSKALQHIYNQQILTAMKYGRNYVNKYEKDKQLPTEMEEKIK